jgi:hypothetical protein
VRVFLAVLGVLALGCPATTGVSRPPPCPQWGAALDDYERLLLLEDDGRIDPRVDALHEYLERVAIYCIAVDAYRGGDLPDGW